MDPRAILFLGLAALLHFPRSLAFGPGLQLESHLRIPEGLVDRRTPVFTDDAIPKFPLPRALEPVNYQLTIRPILEEAPQIGEQFTAPGTVKIRFNCLQNTNVITLHAFLLNINNETIVVTNVATSAPVPLVSTNYEAEKHFYHIEVQGLGSGTAYDVQIDYVAPVSLDRVNGLYLATYTDPENGEERYMAATQLEPARARQVFPCFDEPRWKPTLEVTIGRMAGYESLGNSPLVRTEDDDLNPGWVWDIYGITAPMPVYLFAMAVTFNYECKEAAAGLYRLPVRTCAAKHLIDDGRGNYSVEASAKIIDFFEEHYDLNYPMDKVDSIVVPGKGGAMENYGLITYGDFLLYQNGETSEIQRQRLVNVIAHELAHQWFGNLVTCLSWSHIYLNEGFASYVSYVGEEQFCNEFFPRERILNEAVQSAFIQDAGPASHPIVVENIYTIDEISSHFSNLQYDKGAALIRMMEGFLTEKTLNDGLKAYLKLKEHQVAEQDELFDALTVQAHKDGTLPNEVHLKDIMYSWTLQNGFPLVRVSYWDANNVYISQERFRNHDQGLQQNAKRENEFLWEVPISIATQDNPNFQNYTPATWIPRNAMAKIFRHDTARWIMLNLDGMNFYRVLYDERLLSLIRQQLRTDASVISPLSRSQLIDDYFNLAWQRYVGIERALELTEYMGQESHFTVWHAFFGAFRSGYQILSAADASDSVSAYLLPRLDAALTSIGLPHNPTDKGARVLLRAQLLDWACSMGHQGCLDYTNELITQWQENPENNQFQADLQPVLYCTAVAHGNDQASIVFFLLAQYKTLESIDHKSRIASALSCVTAPALIDAVLSLSLDATSGLSKSDSSLLLQRFAMNPTAHPQLFSFLRTELAAIISFHDSAAPVAGVITLLSQYYSTPAQAVEVQEFITVNADALSEVLPQLYAALNAIEANISWRETFYDKIQRWFETHK